MVLWQMCVKSGSQTARAATHKEMISPAWGGQSLAQKIHYIISLRVY
jgi:hypothetical protein